MSPKCSRQTDRRGFSYSTNKKKKDLMSELMWHSAPQGLPSAAGHPPSFDGAMSHTVWKTATGVLAFASSHVSPSILSPWIKGRR